MDERTDLVARAKVGLRRSGVKQGGVVVGLLPNSLEAVVAFLAAASLGAVWSSCSPESGTGAIWDRFRPLEPTVFLAVASSRYGGKTFNITGKVSLIGASLPSLKLRVFAREGNDISGDSWDSWSDFTVEFEPLEFTPVSFSHPVWVLFSSGTTGLPKGIVLEHLKNLRPHHDVCSGSRFFWFTTTGWLMWNYLVPGLLVEAMLVLYDGSPGWPNLSML